MASPIGITHTPAAVLFTVGAGLYAVWLASWLFGTSGAVPHYATGPLVWMMTIIMVGGPIVMSVLTMWCAVAMFRRPTARTMMNAAALLFGVASILGFLFIFLFALAG